jgi:hypothetical protein
MSSEVLKNTNCPTCGERVPDYFDHIDTECEKWEGLISQLNLGEIGDVEFTELALDAGMSLERIGLELAGARSEDSDDEEDGEINF